MVYLHIALSWAALLVTAVSLAEAKRRTKTVSMCPPAPTHGSNLTCPAPVLANSTRWDGRSWVSDPTNKTWTIAWQPSYNKATDGTGYCNADVNPNNTFTRSCSFEVSCFKALGVMNASLVFHSLNVTLSANNSMQSLDESMGLAYPYALSFSFEENTPMGPHEILRDSYAVFPAVTTRVYGSKSAFARNGAAAVLAETSYNSFRVNITLEATAGYVFPFDIVQSNVTALFECASALPPRVTAPPVTQYTSISARIVIAGSGWREAMGSSWMLPNVMRADIAIMLRTSSFDYFNVSAEADRLIVDFIDRRAPLANITELAAAFANNSNYAFSFELYRMNANVSDCMVMYVALNTTVVDASRSYNGGVDGNFTYNFTASPVDLITPAPDNSIHGNNPAGVVAVICLGTISLATLLFALAFRFYFHKTGTTFADLFAAKAEEPLHSSNEDRLLVLSDLDKLGAKRYEASPAADEHSVTLTKCEDGYEAVESDFKNVEL